MELSFLARGNAAMRKGLFEEALYFFNKALTEADDVGTEIRKVIEFNIDLIQRRLNSDIETNTYEGKLETFKDGKLRGWAVNKQNSSEIFELSIYINDVLYKKITNDKKRDDLLKAGKSTTGIGGFIVDIAHDIFNNSVNEVVLKASNGYKISSLTVPAQQEYNLLNKQNSIVVAKNPSNNLKYEGKLEQVNDNSLKGWAVKKGNVGEIFDLTIFVDGIFYAKVSNNQSRNDLLQKQKSLGKGGFVVNFPSRLFEKSEYKIEIFYPNGEILDKVSFKKNHNTASYEDIMLLPVNSEIAVIVPVFNAVDDVEICMKRLKKYTPDDVEIIVIDDSSTDPLIAEVLKKAEKKYGFKIYRNQKNLGFTKTVNYGIELAGHKDVVLLNSDARVTPRWIEGFRRALATDAKIATVTAMSDRAGAFSAPNIGNDNDLGGVKEEDYAIAFRRRASGVYPTVPTGNGFCMYIRRKCLDEIGGLDEKAFPRGYGEENDFCMRARAADWRNIIDDRTYIFHDRSKSFGSQKTDLISAGRAIVDSRYPDYKKAISVFHESAVINLARFNARQALEDCKSTILPRGLFVISTLTGGTPQTNRDLMNAISDRVECWLLHCDRKIISLYRVHHNKPDQLIRQHILQEPVEVLTHYCAEYDRVLVNWLHKFDFEFVHIRHLAWHSLSLPRLAKEAGAKVINSFHDFYTICPTVKLLDGNNVYCGGICSKAGQCQPDLWGSDSLPPLRDAWVHQWRSRFASALSYCDVFITTHESVKQTISNYLNIPSNKFYVIPHGRDFNQFYQLAEPYKKGDVLRILVPGNISVPKGSKIIEELLKRDMKGMLHFHILGKSNIKFNHPRLTLHGEYKRDDFANHVKQIKPHIGAVFSIWNETWCHTLTELWSVGLPVLVTNFATLADRVRQHGGGWVVNDLDVGICFTSLEAIASNPLDIASKVQLTISKQESLRLENNSLMAIEYNKHYLGVYDE